MTAAPAPDWHLADFDFHLPEERIAAHPVDPRDHARLLHVCGKNLSDHHVFDLPALLHEGDVLVMNDTKVIPARLFGLRGEVRVEVMLNKREAGDGEVWSALARPGKRLREGQVIVFAPDFSSEILSKKEGGEILVRFNQEKDAFFAAVHAHGHIPLPPYIKRPDGDMPEDRTRYQTIYARHEGAVAAPTAGLHFTPELFAKLDEKGITRTTVTLHVGAGTFLPVKTERVADHVMHSEWGEITPETAVSLNAAKREGRRIVVVGTTSLRLLESSADETGMIHPFCGETDIFITPGYRFRAIDAMLTNFHLPKSTLFMLVSALAGLEPMRSAYAHAIDNDYRFYSYGDACLLEKETTSF
ncbi:MAG: tRNA preQ1(34) S-adenosylmethionine ribosyltransferase-isomerase QueA [Proteobacteria bacterium]|jgi:S-adenosylmethionine:tRNA ribosyltransferase-isomerase|nr:tRNA preQ1(34) S-adenosylmethionine ribosyltransferase-isomerase QueA [Alphaproteobacteria bacterium]NCC02933.1 tRNA preQ1(34) S-adenosylmethionine ribosyltransferase-isomerase QueA [Pseudomonadota bacterium]